MRKLKEPKKYTLEEIRAIANKQFPPPWSVLEWLVKLEDYVKAYHNCEIRHGRGKLNEDSTVRTS